MQMNLRRYYILAMHDADVAGILRTHQDAVPQKRIARDLRVTTNSTLTRLYAIICAGSILWIQNSECQYSSLNNEGATIFSDILRTHIPDEFTCVDFICSFGCGPSMGNIKIADVALSWIGEPFWINFWLPWATSGVEKGALGAPVLNSVALSWIGEPLWTNFCLPYATFGVEKGPVLELLG